MNTYNRRRSQTEIHSKHQWQVVDKFCQYSIELAFIDIRKIPTRLQSTTYLAKGSTPWGNFGRLHPTNSTPVWSLEGLGVDGLASG
jgi:hypothetical protein